MRIVGYLMLLATVGLSILNAMPFSPLYDSVAYFLYLFTRSSVDLPADVLAYLSSLFLGALTLLLAGVPAAIYERIRRLRHSTLVSLAIWLVAAALLTLPAIMRLLGEE
jgi:hypothetical protein